jgi:hypothetical protein
VRLQRFTVRIGDGVSIVEDASYSELVERVLEFVVRAGMAKASDDCNWEEEELRRRGLRVLEIVRDGKALWWDPDAFEAESREATREGAHKEFVARNEAGESLLEGLDSDVRERLRCAGYATRSLLGGMEDLYAQIAADASERSAQAREGLLVEILGT